MSKIVSKTLWFDMVDPTDIKYYNVYYVKEGETLNYDSPKVVLTAVPGQTAYSIDIPAMVPIGEGTYQLGVAAVDTSGNISDIATMTGFFDFTAPVAPVWRVVV